MTSGLTRQFVKKLVSGPLFSPVRRLYTGCATVLMYHSITEEVYPEAEWRDPSHFLPHLGLSVQKESFRAQMGLLRDQFNPVSLQELSEGLRKGVLPKGSVCVTFDDGWQDNLSLALPILEEFQIPATVFVTSGFVKRQAVPWWLELEQLISVNDELLDTNGNSEERVNLSSPQEKNTFFARINDELRRLPYGDQLTRLKALQSEAKTVPASQNERALSAAELQQLSKSRLVTIGAHTVHHPVLSCEDEESAKRELSSARFSIQDTIERKVQFFAYPFGDEQAVGLREFAFAEEAGYELAFTTRPGHVFYQHEDHRSALPRINVDYFDTLERFEQKLNGFEVISRRPSAPFVTA